MKQQLTHPWQVRACMLLLALCFLGSLTSRAQLSQLTPNTPGHPINTCGPIDTLTLSIGTGASTFTGNAFTITLPTGLQYVAGSAFIDNAATINSVSGTTTTPVFNIATLPSGNFTLSFKVTASCSFTGGSYSVAATATSGGNTPLVASAALNAQSAVFVIPSMTNQNINGTVLQTYSRTANIVNSGNGTVDTLLLIDTVGKGRVVTSIAGVAGVTASLMGKVPANSGNDTIYTWKIYGFAGIGNGNAHLENNETFSVTQSLTIVGCNNLSDKLYAVPLCIGVAGSCNRGLITGGATVANTGSPNIVIAVTPYNPGVPYFCTDGLTPTNTSVKFTNTGTAPAYNVHLYLGTNNLTGYINYGTAWYDTATLMLKTNNGSYIQAHADSIVLTTGVANCAFNKPWQVGVTVPVIQPGDSVRLSYNLYRCNQGAVPNCSSYRYGYNTALASYQDACLGPVVKTNFVNQINLQAVAYDFTKGNNVVNIYPGSTNTLVYGANNVTLGNQLFVRTASGSFKYQVTLPSFLSLPAGLTNVELTNGSTTLNPVSVTQIASTATDTTYEIVFNFSQIPSSFGSVVQTFLSNATIYLKNLTGNVCAGNGTTIQAAVLYFAIRADNSTCSPYAYTGCFTDNLSFICPTICGSGGISGSRLSMIRTNYGLPDALNNGSANGATLDFAKVRTDMATNGDTIAAIGTGKVLFGTQSNFTNGYFEPKTSAFSPLVAGGLVPLDGRIAVYSSTGVLRGTCTNLPLVSTGNNQVRADFSISQISACIPGYTQFANGDSLIVTIRYRSTYSTQSPNLTALIPGNLYLSNIANPTAATDIYACDTGRASFTLVPGYITTGTAPSFSGNVCDTLTIGLNAYIGIGNTNYSNSNFVYEYRPMGVISKYVIYLQNGYRYRNIATITANVGTPAQTGLPINVSNTATVYADSVVFDLRNLYTDMGGAINIMDEGCQFTLSVRLSPPACGSGISQPVSAQYRAFYTPLSNPAFNGYGAFNTINGNINYPQLSITTSPQTQTVTSNTAVWELQVSNASSALAAPNTWIAKGPGGTTSIQSLQLLTGSGGTVVSTVPQNGGIYQLGGMPTNTSRYYRATVTYANCVKDSLNIAYANGCTGYPSSFATASCYNLVTPLYIIPQPSQLQMSLLMQPTGQQSLCVDTTYILQLSNPQLGTVYNAAITATLPANDFAITAGTSMVDTGTGFHTIAEPTLAGGVYSWNIGDSLMGLKTLQLRFKAGAAGCGYNSGDYPVFNAKGVNGCGSLLAVPSISGHQFILQGDPLNTVNNYILHKTVSSPTLIACPDQNLIYTYVATNNGTAPSSSATETVSIEVPSWLSMNAGSLQDIKNAATLGTPSVTTLGAIKTLSWPMPNGIVVGDSLKFGITLSPSVAAPANCGDVAKIRNYVTNTFSTSASACSGGGSCVTKSIRGFDTVSVTIQKYNLIPAYLLVTNASTNNVTVKITNAGSVSFPATGTIEYALWGDMNGNNALDAGDLQSSPTYTETGTGLAANAADTFTVTFTLMQSQLAAATIGKNAILVVKDSSCNCSNTFRMADAGSTPLPLDLVSFTATADKCSARVNWTTVNESNIEKFEVERSTDGNGFDVVGTVPATNNGKEQHHYNFRDNNVESGAKYFYRLRMQERAGTSSVSKIANVMISNCGTTGNVSVYPNPVKQGAAFTVLLNNLTAGNYEVTVQDMYGRMVKRMTVLMSGSSVAQQFDISGVAAGSYFVQVAASDSNSSTSSYHVKVDVK